MKMQNLKKSALILALTSFALLSSCGQKPVSSLESSVESSISSSSSASSSSSVSSSSKKDFVVDINTELKTNEWDERMVAMLEYTVGDAAEAIPSYKANNYYAFIDSQTNSSTGEEIIYTEIQCYPVSGKVIESYRTKLGLCDFYHSYSSSYSYYKASATDDLIVQYEVVEGEDYSYLDILCYRVTLRQKDWPTEFVGAVLGADLPHYKAESYEMFFDSYNMVGSIYCGNTRPDADTEYASILKEAGYTVSSTTSASTTLVSADGYFTITLFMTYDEFEDDSLGIKFENAWPYIDLVALLGRDWVKYEGAEFSYNYVQSGESYILTLYYDNADEIDYAAIRTLYEKNGCIADSSYEEPIGSYVSDSIGTIQYAYYDLETVNGHFAVHVMFAVSLNTIAVAIY